MNIWILGYTYDYEGSDIVAVFSTKAKGEKALDEVKKKTFRYMATYWLTEVVVNDRTKLLSEFDKEFRSLADETTKE